MNPVEWEKQRDILNHDVLCNQLRNELARLRREPCSKSISRLAMWPKRQKEYIEFLEGAVDVISPKRIVDFPIFECWDKHNRESFKAIVHFLYNAIEKIESQVAEAKSVLVESVFLVESFYSLPVKNRTEQKVIKIQNKLDELSRKISKLPHPEIIQV